MEGLNKKAAQLGGLDSLSAIYVDVADLDSEA